MRWLTLGMLVALVAPAVAQPLPDPFRSTDGRYAVRFPGKPKTTTQDVKTEAGSLKVHLATFATTEGNVYLVIYTDYPAVPGDAAGSILDGVRDGLKKDGELLKVTTISIGAEKLPAREVMVKKGEQQLVYRVMLKGSRLYQVGVLGSPGFVSGSEAKAFLESFEITK